MSKLKTQMKKTLSVLLALLLCFTPLVSLRVQAVNYPEGVTESDCIAAIPKLDNLVKTVLSSTGTELSDTVYDALLSSATLNSLFSSVYGSFAGNSSALSLLGLDLSPRKLSQAFAGYGNVSSIVVSCADLSAVVAASSGFDWGVYTKNGFASAAAAMFSPFNDLLYAILCSGTAQLNLLLAVKGDDGYGNCIVPLLQALNCPSIVNSTNFAGAAKNDKNTMVQNIVLMLFSALDQFLTAPVNGCCSTLPSLAWYINEGKLSETVNKLIEPLTVRIGLISIPGIAKLLSGIADLENSADLSSLVKNIDLSSMGAGDVSLTLPELDLAELAKCGSASGDTFVPDRAAAFITVLNFVIETLRKNSSSLASTLGDASSAVDTLLAKSNDELIALLMKLFNPNAELPANMNSFSYPPITPASVSYTPTYGRDTYSEVLDKIDGFLDEVAAESDPDATIYDTVAPLIFSDTTVSSLTVMLFSALGSEETAPLFSLLGLNVTPSGVAAGLSGSYSSAASVLYNYSSWEDIPANGLNFGIEEGSPEDFKKALSTVFAPFVPMLSYVLAEKDLVLFDAVTLPGSDGYNTAIIPLLEALGCPQENIKSYELYETTAQATCVSDILDPLTALLEEICHRPVYELCQRIPNIMYFFTNGGLETTVQNLLYPVTQLLASVGLSDMLPADLTSGMTEFDVSSLTDSLFSTSGASLKLPEPDLKQFANFGTPEKRMSKRTSASAPVQYTYIKADAPAVLITALRYLVNTLSMEENAGLLSGFMNGMMSNADPDAVPDEAEASPDMMSMYVGSITEKFKGMTTDEIIEWLYNLLFRETPKVEPVDNDIYVPADLKRPGAKADVMKIVLILLAVLVILALVLKFLWDKGYLDGLKEKLAAKKAAKPEKPGKKRKPEKKKKLSRKEKKAAAKALKAAGKTKKKKNEKSIPVAGFVGTETPEAPCKTQKTPEALKGAGPLLDPLTDIFAPDKTVSRTPAVKPDKVTSAYGETIVRSGEAPIYEVRTGNPSPAPYTPSAAPYAPASAPSAPAPAPDSSLRSIRSELLIPLSYDEAAEQMNAAAGPDGGSKKKTEKPKKQPAKARPVMDTAGQGLATEKTVSINPMFLDDFTKQAPDASALKDREKLSKRQKKADARNRKNRDKTAQYYREAVKQAEKKK